MNFYFAPMEGITGYIYRRAYHSCFHPMDKYFTPFIAPKQDKTLNSKEKMIFCRSIMRECVWFPRS